MLKFDNVICSVFYELFIRVYAVRIANRMLQDMGYRVPRQATNWTRMAGYGDSYKRGLKFERALPYLKAVNKLGCFASDQTWLKVVPAIYNDIFNIEMLFLNHFWLIPSLRLWIILPTYKELALQSCEARGCVRGREKEEEKQRVKNSLRERKNQWKRER